MNAVADPETLVDPKRVVEALVAAFNARDENAVAALLHPDVMVQGIPLEPAQGREAAMALLAPFLAAEEIDWQVNAIAVTGCTVFTERLDRFHFDGHDWSSVRTAGVWEVTDDGLIIAWRDYFDMAELAAAIPTVN